MRLWVYIENESNSRYYYSRFCIHIVNWLAFTNKSISLINTKERSFQYADTDNYCIIVHVYSDFENTFRSGSKETIKKSNLRRRLSNIYFVRVNVIDPFSFLSLHIILIDHHRSLYSYIFPNLICLRMSFSFLLWENKY